jgi:hypothetical protein
LYERLLADPGLRITQAYLVEGRNRVRVYQPDGDPPPGFSPVAPSLEDGYLVLMKTGGFPAVSDRPPIASQDPATDPFAGTGALEGGDR